MFCDLAIVRGTGHAGHAPIACEEWLEMAGVTLVLAGALGLWCEEAAPVAVTDRLPVHPH